MQLRPGWTQQLGDVPRTSRPLPSRVSSMSAPVLSGFSPRRRWRQACLGSGPFPAAEEPQAGGGPLPGLPWATCPSLSQCPVRPMQGAAWPGRVACPPGGTGLGRPPWPRGPRVGAGWVPAGGRVSGVGRRGRHGPAGAAHSRSGLAAQGGARALVGPFGPAPGSGSLGSHRFSHCPGPRGADPVTAGAQGPRPPRSASAVSGAPAGRVVRPCGPVQSPPALPLPPLSLEAPGLRPMQTEPSPASRLLGHSGARFDVPQQAFRPARSGRLGAEQKAAERRAERSLSVTRAVRPSSSWHPALHSFTPSSFVHSLSPSQSAEEGIHGVPPAARRPPHPPPHLPERGVLATSMSLVVRSPRGRAGWGPRSRGVGGGWAGAEARPGETRGVCTHTHVHRVPGCRQARPGRTLIGAGEGAAQPGAPPCCLPGSRARAGPRGVWACVCCRPHRRSRSVGPGLGLASSQENVAQTWPFFPKSN